MIHCNCSTTLKRYLTTTGLFAFSIFIFAQTAQKSLFDPTILHIVEIESAQVSNLWDSISRDFLMVNLIIDGNRLDSVGLKLRGATSASSDQTPLEVDLNKYIRGKHYDGYKKFNLRNNYLDLFLQRENLSYDLYRRAGLPTPRCAYAEVFVNGTSRGVYSMVEGIDKRFLEDHFPSVNGSLYKGKAGFKGLTVEVKQGTMTELDHFRRSLRAHNLDDFVELSNYLKHLSTDIIIGDWDSYSYGRHNFYFYYEPKSLKMHLINWDHNFAFSSEKQTFDPYPKATFPSIDNLIEYPELISKYQQTLCELLSFLVDSSYITHQAMANYHIITSNQNGWKANSPEPLIDSILSRKVWLIDTLQMLGVSCKTIAYPLGANALVINEIMVRGEKKVSGTKTESSGWIELYNQSNTNIELNEHYYLSNERSIPKKWSFKDEVTIPAKGYIVIWADDKVSKNGLHTGFKLNKDGGELLLTYEDMTLIDLVKYEKLEKGVSTARRPDGTGAFIHTVPTFNASNQP